MLKIINISVFFYIYMVISFQLGFKTLILLLILWFYIFQTFKSLLYSFKLQFSSRKLVPQFGLILCQLLDGLIHLGHFAGLIFDDVADTFFDVNLLGICV